MARIPGQFVPLYVHYPRDRAIRSAGPDAELLFIRSLVFVKASGTDGFVAEFDLEVVSVGLRGVKKSVAALIRVALWEEVDGGWMVRSFGKWNMSTEQQAEAKTARKNGGITGNHKRWHVAKGEFNKDCELCMTDRSTDRSTDPSTESPSDRSVIAERREREERGDKREALRASPVPHQRDFDVEAHELETVSPETVFPRSWRPNTRHQAYAMENALNIQDEALGFAAHARANGRTAVDWDAAFAGWMLKSKKSPAVRRSTDDKVRGGLALAARLAAQEAQTKEIGS